MTQTAKPKRAKKVEATLCLTIPALNKLKPCAESGRRVRAALKNLNADKEHCFTAAEARAAGCTYDDVIWAASAIAMTDHEVARRLTGFLNDNAKRVLHIFEEAAPDDMRVRECIQATDDWLARRITEYQWREAAWAARAARAAWADRAARAAWDARAAWAARDEFQTWQFDRLVAWLSPVAPEPLPMPAIQTREAA